jgi:hypothetical protein
MANLTPPRLQTRAPLATDDSSTGAWLGMVWINTLTNIAYIATKVTLGAAVWATLGASAGLLGIVISQTEVIFPAVSVGVQLVVSDGVVV